VFIGKNLPSDKIQKGLAHSLNDQNEDFIQEFSKWKKKESFSIKPIKTTSSII